jgi:glycosyltransferase involved in cell wall biosynthesis
MTKSIEVVAVLRMGDPNSFYHLKPIAMSEKVSLLHVIRPLPLNVRNKIEKSKYYEIQGATIFHRLWRVYRQAVRLGMRPKVRAFVSFYAFPYGFIALLAGMRTGKPVHIGFVGSDWHRILKSWYGSFLNIFIRRADLITVTGPKMKEEMVERNYPAKNIFHLPHAIDISRFSSDSAPEKRRYDCLFVGYLAALKRVDLIISAINILKPRYPDISVCIVGDGPERSLLESQTEKLGLKDNITFLGFQPEPAKWFSDARILLIVSDKEGLPFVLIEGMASGTVPICTSVGTIPDFIDYGKTGLLIRPGDYEELAHSIRLLMEDNNLYTAIRNNILDKKNDLGFQSVADRWTEWLSDMSN